MRARAADGSSFTRPPLSALEMARHMNGYATE